MKAQKDGGVRWMEKISAIMMDDDAYYAYIKVRALQLLLHFIHQVIYDGYC
jgi:hypothetical protein